MATGLSRLRGTMVCVAALTITAACGSSSPTNPSSGQSAVVLQFTHLPVFHAAPPGNFGVTQAGYRSSGVRPVRPYLQFFSSGAGPGDVSVFAPATGLVTGITEDADGSRRLEVTAGGGFRYYLTGPGLTFSVTSGVIITAGQVVGQREGAFSQGPSGVGLGVIHPTRRLGFVSPDRYADDLLYAASPLDYYVEPFRSLIVNALGPTSTAGELSFDIPGRLQGFWYLPTIPRSESTSAAHRDGWLWFCETVNAGNLGMPRVSVIAPSYDGRGTTYFLEPDSGPAAADVSPTSGMVTYRFPYSETNAVVLRVEMLTETSVRAETFDTHYGLPTGFTSAAQVFVR